MTTHNRKNLMIFQTRAIRQPESNYGSDWGWRKVGTVCTTGNTENKNGYSQMPRVGRSALASQGHFDKPAARAAFVSVCLAWHNQARFLELASILLITVFAEPTGWATAWECYRGEGIRHLRDPRYSKATMRPGTGYQHCTILWRIKKQCRHAPHCFLQRLSVQLAYISYAMGRYLPLRWYSSDRGMAAYWKWSRSIPQGQSMAHRHRCWNWRRYRSPSR